MFASPMRPASEMMSTIRPRLAATMPGSTAWQQWKVP